MAPNYCKKERIYKTATRLRSNTNKWSESVVNSVRYNCIYVLLTFEFFLETPTMQSSLPHFGTIVVK